MSLFSLLQGIEKKVTEKTSGTVFNLAKLDSGPTQSSTKTTTKLCNHRGFLTENQVDFVWAQKLSTDGAGLHNVSSAKTEPLLSIVNKRVLLQYISTGNFPKGNATATIG